MAQNLFTQCEACLKAKRRSLPAVLIKYDKSVRLFTVIVIKIPIKRSETTMCAGKPHHSEPVNCRRAIARSTFPFHLNAVCTEAIIFLQDNQHQAFRTFIPALLNCALRFHKRSFEDGVMAV
jgi:hypothetical protein